MDVCLKGRWSTTSSQSEEVEMEKMKMQMGIYGRQVIVSPLQSSPPNPDLVHEKIGEAVGFDCGMLIINVQPLRDNWWRLYNEMLSTS